jgi:hypothetical protein
VPAFRTHNARTDIRTMPGNFLSPGEEAAKPTGGMAGGRSADRSTDDAFGDQHAARDGIKTARKVCIAPMMDWTDVGTTAIRNSNLRKCEKSRQHFGSNGGWR